MNDILKTALTDPCVMHRTCKAEESSVPSQFPVTLKMVSAQGFRVMILEPGKTKLKFCKELDCAQAAQINCD
jgi:hypothetical protein